MEIAPPEVLSIVPPFIEKVAWTTPAALAPMALALFKFKVPLAKVNPVKKLFAPAKVVLPVPLILVH